MSESKQKKNIKNIRFSSDKFKQKEFNQNTFINCDFSNLNLFDTKFFESTFKNCNFGNTKFSATQFQECLFDECKLLGVGIGRANFAFSADFIDCDLQYVDFSELNLNKKKIYNCNCSNARFVNCNLSYGNFNKSDFNSTLFHKCDLRNAQFLEVKNLFINPLENKIKKTKIDLLTASNISRNFGFIIE